MEVLITVLVMACLGTGFAAGWGSKPDKAHKAIEAQALVIGELQKGQQQIIEQVQRPVVIDAELRATLAEIPVQCRKDAGGDPRSVQCQWATCLQFGQSAAQRPECREVESVMVRTLERSFAGEKCATD